MSAPILLCAALAAFPAHAGVAHDATPGLSGLVKHGPGPLDQAGVYAYRVTDLDLTRVTTGVDGRFLFRTLPAGVYKIIAHKAGYVPAVVLFTRATQMASDFLEFELVAQSRAEIDSTDDFWSIRRKIPGDVLRDIQFAEAAHQPAAPSRQTQDFELRAELRGGSQSFAGAGTSQLRQGSVGLDSRIGDTRVSLESSLDTLRPGTTAAGTVNGRTQAIALTLQSAERPRSSIAFSALDHSFETPSAAGGSDVDLEAYQVSWTRESTSGAQTGLTARLVDETGFHTQALVQPEGAPAASRTVQLSTFHRRNIGESRAFRTGIDYRQVELFSTPLGSAPFAALERQHEWLNAYGIGTSRLPSGLVVEYGLYSTLLDGTLSLSPHGSVVMEIDENWSADAAFRQRLSSQPSPLPTFTQAYYEDVGAHGGAENHYYQLGVTRSLGEAERVAVAARHREVSDTVRVFFSEDYFDQVESIYLVRGDVVPELQVELTQKLAPRIFTTVESNIADGGGGVFKLPENGRYSNQVRYLVTSMDTEFQRTATGLLLAFHRVEQRLDPMMRRFAVGLRSPISSPDVVDTELDTLQLKVTQELPFLMDLGTNLAVLLNFELSRGASPYTESFIDADELRRRVAGGIALRF
ncbi:MAG: carboxypeptidase-like regulatory domain-containing protein [Acidobacteriota bacterium]|nr:carboxypeptidase-like regulatory domain-containing protein [Acidobacteriota bacterium]